MVENTERGRMPPEDDHSPASRKLPMRNEIPQTSLLEIHSYRQRSMVEGPWMRFVVWVQGCSLRCHGCANAHMWESGKGQLFNIDYFFDKINSDSEIEGVTFLGGEPLDQAFPLAMLAEKVQRSGKGIVTFTGYRYEQIRRFGTRSQKELLKYTDLLIDSPFIMDLITYELPWIGSSNQRYIHISDRYWNYDFDAVENGIEIHFNGEDGKIRINGMDDVDTIKSLLSKLRLKGLTRGVPLPSKEVAEMKALERGKLDHVRRLR